MATPTPSPTPTPTPTVCYCLAFDSNLVTAATGNTNTSLDNVVNIDYLDCSGTITTFTQTTLSAFYLCTLSGTVERVAFYQDDVLYDSPTPFTSPWNPIPGFNIGYTSYGDCFGDPCGVVPTPTPNPTPTLTLTISVNEQYATDFIDCCDVSGTTIPSDSYVPHPVWTNNDGNISITQLNAVTLGGFNGLNN